MTEALIIRRSHRHFSRGWFLLLLAIALLLPCSESLSGKAGNTFSRLVQIVADSGENAQQDFAWIALAELIAAYEKVYLSSRSERPREKKSREKLISWRSGTQSYISQLHSLLDRLPGSVELQLQVEAAGPPIIVIDGNPVVISGPEIGSAMLMEKRIIDTYCAMYDCSELDDIAEQRSAVVTTAGRGVWNLRKFGKASYETPDGLVFTFSGISGRKLKQQICEALALELRGLASGLRDAVNAGYAVDWNSLEIQTLAGSRGHKVLFNSAGEYIRMEIPELAQLGALPSGLLAWIKQRTTEEEPTEVEIFADRLLLMRKSFELE
jgi:hypothetical protein